TEGSGVTFATTIGRLGHEIRPTAPYTDETWESLLAAGDRADAALAAADLAVWTGGEPTFVARDDQMAEEWQGGALGPGKWTKGRRLAEQLRDKLAPGGLVLHRMGKHYPGEPLPRWALDVIGLRGGELWPVRALREGGAVADARVFAEALAVTLGVPTALHAAHEDPWEKLKADAALPIGELRMLPDGIAGYVLPIAREARAWRTQRWDFRRGALYLAPGTSPIGLRLPLSSLAAAPPQPEWIDQPDLPDPRRAPQPARIKDASRPSAAPAVRATIRTAIAIEPRDGQLWIFLPPVSIGDDFVDLVAAVDRARAATGLAAHLEGYAPPPSPRLVRFAVTPDPGVLEVNLPPADTCRALSDLHHTVFDAALASGLTAERYLLDGRLAGSGGGNHITIGGPRPAESPWLVRPDLLGSLVTFAQHHPSLAYLFSGLFVGPTSQAPRVDEARHEALAELELALPRLFAEPPPPAWQVDALLRHLLVDVTGSTHRAELSIDKLFDPVAPFGRQGLVEFRAFEMPPHPRMAAAQAILVRALVAAFAARPYQQPLVRWGSELHDRFLLPYYLWRDFADVLAATGLPADAYRPFVELRCPLAGALDVAGGRLEIRNALEPWHVLGEEATAVGTARYVDSSVERVEVRAIGLPEERYAIAVNGVGVPLRSPDGRDLRVGGVRFRAWCPPHALHPHLGIHHPLRFAVIDRWAKRAVAGATYHVWHPEGRAFDAAPLTRVEAEARRAQRFTREGAPAEYREVAPDPTHPFTLDLRRVDVGSPMPDPKDWE
ncbi:MAG TPA: transglutaminase family protein, partial [Kofleriaceae bacterium]